MVRSNIHPGIEGSHVLQAIEDIRVGAQHGFGESTKYDLVNEGERSPRKAIPRGTGTPAPNRGRRSLDSARELL
jgi:hypothetical protein